MKYLATHNSSRHRPKETGFRNGGDGANDGTRQQRRARDRAEAQRVATKETGSRRYWREHLHA